MVRQHILVVEDDSAIRQGIVDALEVEGYETREAARGDEGLRMALEGEFDLVLLDLVMPGMRGLDVLAELRRARATLPVIILTALGDESDRVRGLRLGADDYVVKPFGVGELMARVQAVLRRSPERQAALSGADLPNGRIDFDRFEVTFADGHRAALSPREVELLRYLAENGGRAVSRDEILLRVWGLNPRGVETRTIDMHVARLREKLRDDSTKPRVIMTVRGKGYVFGAAEVDA